ncbi:CaiB/BaiF CoA transferase family protein [Pseudonocardia sp. GCM10023141]|uniref:CaiB/BaiF CoA transferase family protein n=1 Tax=Pseudonocardia sp. GCM10023141 TaxID=3252653 RepID=UPI003615851D
MSPGPLAGLRVVELAGLGPGPFCAMLLADADAGADVIRVERDTRDPGPGPLVRGRTVVVADLKTGAGLALVRDLVGRADVLLEGFRPGVTERLGLGPQECLVANPRLVYGWMTGWGRTGPLAQRAGHDINYLAVTGALHAMRRAGSAPVPPLNLVADYGGGGMLLAFGVLAALHERTASGRGQIVDAAMIDGVSLLMTGIWSRLAEGRWPGPAGSNELDSGAPFYDVYATADGEHMAVGAIEPQFWSRLLAVLGIDPATVADQWDRPQWTATKARIAHAFAARTRAAWTAAFADVDACVTPVRSMAEAVAEPQMQAGATLVDVDGVVHPAPAPRLSRTPMRPQRPPGPDHDAAAALARWGAAAQLVETGGSRA